MRKLLASILCLNACVACAQTNTYEKAWAALNENKRSDAASLLSQAMNEPSTAQDAFVTNLYLQTYNGKEKEIKDFASSFYYKVQNPYPYVYAMWFSNAVIGGFGKKNSDNQIRLIDQLLTDKNTPGTLVAAANFQKEMHALYSADFDKAKIYSAQIGNLNNWQFTGPFENLSESGFYKNYGPLEHPEPGAVFKSLTNTDVKWFTPANQVKEGWTPVIYQFNKKVAVVYAQNFITSPVDQSVYCTVGATGSIKVWVNDELIIAESKEHATAMDSYTTKYDLKKGVNRVLIQIGYSNASYPSFCFRITDENFKPITNLSNSTAYAPYVKSTNNLKPVLVPLFAEQFFKDKIEKESQNLVNYLLLADVYLRNEKLLEARELLIKALAVAPDNSLIRLKLLDVLNKQNNRTLYLEELEKVKQADPESLLVLTLNIKELYDNEKYEDCWAELNKRIKLYGEDETTDGYKIMLLVKDNKYDDLVKIAENYYAKYPNDARMLDMMYKIKKEVYKDNSGAMKVYETFMNNNYNYDAYIKYADYLIEKGDTKKGLEVKEKLTKIFPYDPVGLSNLSTYYFSIKDYDKAEVYINKSLALSPYNEKYWDQLGDINNEKNRVSEALNAYNQSLKYDPDQYDIISKIRKLNSMPEISKLFAETDVAKVIKDDKPDEAKNTDYGFYYILDQKNVVIYPDGANEEYSTFIIRITNDKGVDRYKESTISYGNSQNLLIEKAEIIKKNQSKIEGERNENHIVFTNLEVGDIIVFKYRLQSYVYGRFSNEYWDRYSFGGKIYSAITRYNLFAPADLKIKYLFTNSSIQPSIQSVESFKKYSWEVIKPQPINDEPLMPLQVDAGNVLHISTIASWSEIANWYSDVTNNKSEEDFEIQTLYKKLFSDNKNLTQFEKAKIIYEYIESNIKYSSVSFRQSAYVPQRASATLTTRLGDCKDLSNLFTTLAHMAGINAQLVLVDTRDNGQNDILLPSVEFNHCIVKAELDNKKYFIELTDNYLPFTSFPNNLGGAIALEIPYKSFSDQAALIHLKSDYRTKDIVKRVIDIKPSNGDLDVAVKTIKYGAFSSSTRQDFLNLNNDKQVQQLEKNIAGSYKNNVKLEQVKFTDLNKLNDSVMYSYNYKVKNEVAEIGSLNMFRIVYPDIVASLNNFSADKRTYPIEYWSYEDADAYETSINISAPMGTKFVELPKGETITFKDMAYSIQYTLKAPDKLIIRRKFSDGRPQQISPGDYIAFKAFFEKIIKAEGRYITYK
jgi:tetratricopeptide (TPR) repeat protein